MNVADIEDGEIIDDDENEEIHQDHCTNVPYDPSDRLHRLQSIDSSNSKSFLFEEYPSPQSSLEMPLEENFGEDLDELELRRVALGSMVNNAQKTPSRKYHRMDSRSRSSRKRRKSSSYSKQRRECQMEIQNLHSIQAKAFSLEQEKSIDINEQIKITIQSLDQNTDLPKDNYETVAMDIGSSEDDNVDAPSEEKLKNPLKSPLYSEVAKSFAGDSIILNVDNSTADVEMNDIDLELLRQKALETLFKSASHNSPQQMTVDEEDIPISDEALLTPLVEYKPEVIDSPSKLPPSEFSSQRQIEDKLPPLIEIQSEIAPPQKVKPILKRTTAKRQPFIIQLGNSSSEEDSDSIENRKFISKQPARSFLPKVNHSLKVTNSDKDPSTSRESAARRTSNPSDRLATINKEMLRRKGLFLKSKLSVYKMKEAIAKKKELRHQVLTDIRTLRNKLKIAMSKYKDCNSGITTDETKLKHLEHLHKNDEMHYNSYSEMFRSYITLTKKKAAVNKKNKALKKSHLLELLGRVSVSCLQHFLYKIDFESILSFSSAKQSHCSQPTSKLSKTILNQPSQSVSNRDESTVAAFNIPSSANILSPNVETKETLIAKSIVSQLQQLSENSPTKSLPHPEIISCFYSKSHSPIANRSVTKAEDQSATLYNSGKMKVNEDHSGNVREPLKESHNPIAVSKSYPEKTKSTASIDLTAPPVNNVKFSIVTKENVRLGNEGKNLAKNSVNPASSLTSKASVSSSADKAPKNNSGKLSRLNNVDKAFENLTFGSKPESSNNVNAIVCPFILDGLCLDKDCEFEHPEYLKSTSQPIKKPTPNLTKEESTPKQSLFDPVMFQMSQPLNLVSHLDCQACSIKIAISTHHLIDDPQCSSCLKSLTASNFCFDEFLNLLHHLHFRISRKLSRGEDATELIKKIIDVCTDCHSKYTTMPDYVLKHCLISLAFDTSKFASQCVNFLRNYDFPSDVCLFALDLCKDYPSKREVVMQCLLYSKSTENTELLNHLLLTYCRLEYMAGRTKQALSFLLDIIKGFSNSSPTSEQMSDLYFTVRLYLDWILHEYLPHNFENYKPFLFTTLLHHEKTILFLYDCLFPGLFKNPIQILRSVNSLSFTPHLVYLLHIFIDFLKAKNKVNNALSIAATLVSVFGLRSFLGSFCHMAFQKTQYFSSQEFLKTYFINEESIQKIYPAAVYFNVIQLINQKELEKAVEMLESFSYWLYLDHCPSSSPDYLYKLILQLDDAFILHPFLKPRIQPSHPCLRRSMVYIWLNYALYGCLRGFHEEISYQLHKVCALRMLSHDDLHLIVHFLLRLLSATVCKVQPLYYSKLAEKLCFYAIPNELEKCSDYFNTEIAELVQQIRLNELTFTLRSEFCTNLIEKRSFNLPLIMSVVKSLLANSNSQDYYLAFTLCQAASFDNPKYEEFWLLYLELCKLNKIPDEVICPLLSKSVRCLPESRRLWAAYHSFSIQSGKTKLQKSLENELKKTGLF